MKKRGGAKPGVHVHKHIYTKGSGGMLFRLYERLRLVHSQGFCSD